MKTRATSSLARRLLLGVLPVLALLAFALPEAKAQYLITTLNLNTPVVYENFNAYRGNAATVPSAGNWTLNGFNDTYRGVGNGNNNAGGLWAYGVDNDDRSFGFLANASTVNQNATAQFQNTSGATITSFVLSFTGEEWRRNSGSSSQITVFYGTTLAGATTALGNSTWAPVNGTTANGSLISSATINADNTAISLANGESLFIRFAYLGGSGTREGLSFDDVTVRFNGTGGGGSTDYFWAGNGVDLGGSGTWNGSNTNWSVTNSPVLGIAWDSSKKAIFAGTAGTVTVDSVSANSGMVFSNTGYQLTSGTLTLGGASAAVNSITTDSGVTATINTTLAGAAGMTKLGAGTLVLGASNSFSGGLAINGGGLSVSSDGNLGAAGNDVTLGGGTLVVTSGLTADSGRDFSGSGTIDIAASQVLQIDGNFSMTALTLNNTGTLDLNGGIRNVGALTFGAAATIDASGAITVTSIDAAGLTSGTATISNEITFASVGDKNVTVGTGGELVIDGNISGINTNNRIVKLGAGTLVANGGNTGGFRLGAAGTTNGGTLVVAAAAAMGSNTFQFNYGTLVASAPMTITNALSIGGREPTAAVIGGTNAIEFSGPVSWFNGASNTFVQVNNESTMSGVITNAAGDVDLVFGGAGTLTMSGASANVFTNELVITNTLTVNLNKSANTTAVGGNVTVNTGATLLVSASGQVADTSVVTLSGGTIQRASGVSETFGDLNLTADSVLDYTSGTQGTLEFGIYESDLAPDFKLTLNNFFQGNKLIFANDLSAYIDASFVGTSFDNSYFAINGMAAAGFTSSWNGSTFTITAIPEPGTVAAAAGLLGLMLWPARRRLLALATRRA